jgi:general secretion pathway protein G
MRFRLGSGAYRGFTFIELTMVLAIMAVLALAATPYVKLEVQRGKENELRRSLIQIREALDAYKQASQQGRILQRIGSNGYPATLNELVDGVLDQRSPVKQKLYFLRRLPRDPFYPYSDVPAAETWATRSYQSPPDSPREGEDVFDVYSKSNLVGLNGVAYRDW